MSQGNALKEVIAATILWQETIQDNQQITATTVDQASTLLSQIYQDADSALDKLMNTDTATGSYNPADGKPPPSSGTNYSNEISMWETNYNKTSQEWQNLENTWNTPIQSLSTEEQSLGDDSQEASQVASTMIQPMQMTANLLESQL